MTAPHRRPRLARLAAAATGLVTLAAGFVAASPAPAPATPAAPAARATGAAATSGVCSGMRRCRVVSTHDVDGDGKADQVAWIQRSKRIAVIRVKTAAGAVASRRVNVELWPDGGVWAGSAHVDGRPGVELLVGSTLGAHTPNYTMLTWRQGRLVVEKSPVGADTWWVDSALSDVAGWWRRIVHGHVRLRRAYAVRDAAFRNYNGHNVYYRWHHGQWQKVRSVRTHYRPKQAYPQAGFHIRGLAEFPGL